MGNQEVLYQVSEVIEDRRLNPKEGSYTNYLFDKGIDKILKKVGEEATETIIAAKNADKKEIVYEMSDLPSYCSHGCDRRYMGRYNGRTRKTRA